MPLFKSNGDVLPDLREPIIIVFTFSMLVSIGIICNITVDKELIMELIDEVLSNYINDSEDK